MRLRHVTARSLIWTVDPGRPRSRTRRAAPAEPRPRTIAGTAGRDTAITAPTRNRYRPTPPARPTPVRWPERPAGPVAGAAGLDAELVARRVAQPASVPADRSVLPGRAASRRPCSRPGPPHRHPEGPAGIGSAAMHNLDPSRRLPSSAVDPFPNRPPDKGRRALDVSAQHPTNRRRTAGRVSSRRPLHSNRRPRHPPARTAHCRRDQSRRPWREA